MRLLQKFLKHMLVWLHVTIKGTFPAKYFDKKTTVTATPVLTYAGGETAFEKVQVLQGESVQANNKVITYNWW